MRNFLTLPVVTTSCSRIKNRMQLHSLALALRDESFILAH